MSYWSLDEEKGYHFSDKKFLSFKKLDEKSRYLAGYFKQLNSNSLPIVVSLATHEVTVCVYFACLKLDGAFVPSSVPRHRYDRAKLKSIIEDIKPGLVILENKEVLEDITIEPHTKVLDKHELIDYLHTFHKGVCLEEFETSSLNLVQFSSGSTHKPKGIKLDKTQLLSNLELIQKSINLTKDDKICTWLPFHHDMGLIGGLLLSARYGVDTHILTPQEFTLRPLKWLETISNNRCTVTAAPNFAYDLCTNRIEKHPDQKLDLSCLRVAVNGSEFVKPQTLERFSKSFSTHGLLKNALKPAYGLAEAALLVTMTDEEGYDVHKFSRTLLDKGEAGACSIEDDMDLELISCGKAPKEIELCIVDRDTFEERPRYHIGEIWVKSPSTAFGYVNPSKNQTEVFNQTKATGETGFLRTGDTGFLDQNNNLFITGRLKDAFTINGRNIMADDLESVVQEKMFAKHTDASYRCAAVCLHKEGKAHLSIIQEVPHRLAVSHTLLELDSLIYRTFHIKPEKIVLVPRGCLPRTTSGKIKRHAAGVLLEHNLLDIYEIV